MINAGNEPRYFILLVWSVNHSAIWSSYWVYVLIFNLIYYLKMMKHRMSGWDGSDATRLY